MPITPELLDELLKDYHSPDDMFGNDGLLQQLAKAVLERALQGEMTHHLGYEKHDIAGKNSGNSRNGKSSKTIKGKRRSCRNRCAARPRVKLRAAAYQERSDAL